MSKQPLSEPDNLTIRPTLKCVKQSSYRDNSPKSPYKLEKKIASTILSLIYTSYLNSSTIIVKHINKKYRTETNKLTDDIWKAKINEQINNEIVILSKIKHPNIINMISYINNDFYCEIILEYCKYGDLFEFINNTTNKLDETFIINIMKQLINALHYLHQHNICHNDISLVNILIYSKDPLTIKLCDFGCSTITKLLKNKSDDILKLGNILFNLMFKYQYNDEDLSHLNNSYSSELNEILVQMLNPDYQSRITSEELFNNDLFQ